MVIGNSEILVVVFALLALVAHKTDCSPTDRLIVYQRRKIDLHFELKAKMFFYL